MSCSRPIARRFRRRSKGTARAIRLRTNSAARATNGSSTERRCPGSATNLQQLRHARLAVGEEAAIPAAWFDIGEATLVRLPQRYRRIAEDRYWYSSPESDYEAVLEMAENGFVRLYPGLWEMETSD